MQCDDVTWMIINRRHCCFKLKTQSQSFCRNEYNLTGLCNRKACPLANSQYATIREHKGVLFLYIREAERVYTPAKQWKKVKLSKTFVKALQQIEDNLVFWPQYFRQKCRQRALKITQYLARMRKMQLNDTKKIVPVRRKEERRLAKREEKALVAAKLDHAIEKALLNRLKKGSYQRIYNFPKQAFNILTEEAEEDVLDEELDDVEEEVEGETVAVKDEETEEEVDEEFQEALGDYLVRQRRDESDNESEDDADDADFSGEESNDEVESEGESEEEEVDDVGQIEYVADFDESEDEDNVDDIENAAAKLNIGKDDPSGKISKAGPSARVILKGKALKSVAIASVPAASSGLAAEEGISSDEERSEEISRKKYGTKVPVKPFSKFGLKRKLNKQKLRQIYEKEKAAKKVKTAPIKR